MRPGEELLLGGYHFRFQGVRELPGPNYQAREGLFEVRRGGRLKTRLNPQKRRYVGDTQEMTEAAIHWNLSRDLYIVLGEPVADEGWTVRLRYLPGIRCLMLGGGLILCGGLLGLRRWGRGRAVGYKQPRGREQSRGWKQPQEQPQEQEQPQ